MTDASTLTPASLRVFATVGTHEKGFPRFLKTIQEVVERSKGTTWIIQTGPMSYSEQSNVETIPFLSHTDFCQQVAIADVMISQASPGNLFAAIRAHTPAILFPRLNDLGEAAGNHQAEFADHVQNHELAHIATDADSMFQALESIRHADPGALRKRLASIDKQSQQNTRDFIVGFSQSIDELLVHRR